VDAVEGSKMPLFMPSFRHVPSFAVNVKQLMENFRVFIPQNPHISAQLCVFLLQSSNFSFQSCDLFVCILLAIDQAV
jgi:hypothetical protein